MNQETLKKFIQNSKEIRRQIIGIGFNSVAEWSRSVGLEYNLIKMQLSGRRAITQNLLRELNSTKIKILLGEVKYGKLQSLQQIHSRADRKNKESIKKRTKAVTGKKAVRDNRDNNSFSHSAISTGNTTGDQG